MKDTLERAHQHAKGLIEQQQIRAERLAREGASKKASPLPATIALVPGDGIGPIIMKHTVKVLEQLLRNRIPSGQVTLRWIEGMSLTERQSSGQTVPQGVMEQLRACPIILKGPTSTPTALDNTPMESANVTLRRELDLFANIRPVSIPEEGVSWVMFRENTEGSYTLGSQGVNLGEWALDFTVTSRAGSLRIARAAFEYARRSGRKKVSIVTKANIIKATDGMFLSCAREVAKSYPEISTDEWYVDIMAANLVNPQMRPQFEVLLMPNLYGDILSDEAAQLQGGVGSAGSANVGEHYALFEAVHGSAPRLVEQGLSEYADPSGLLNASILMLEHLGLTEEASGLKRAMERCQQQGICVTGSPEQSSGAKLADALLGELVG